jgi:hypothetical protein
MKIEFYVLRNDAGLIEYIDDDFYFCDLQDVMDATHFETESEALKFKQKRGVPNDFQPVVVTITVGNLE